MSQETGTRNWTFGQLRERVRTMEGVHFSAGRDRRPTQR
jgi:hypothetical protein